MACLYESCTACSAKSTKLQAVYLDFGYFTAFLLYMKVFELIDFQISGL